MNHDPNALDEMLYLCRDYYMCNSNTAQLQKIDDFEKDYNRTKAIHYYTLDSFVFRQVNQAFRLENIARIYTFRVYMTDLYKEIVRHAKSRPILQSDLQLYRGKKLSNTVLQQLSDNKNKLISINGFLSTTQDIEVAKIFADVGQTREGYESTLLKLCIDKSTIVRSPFADIKEDSMNKDELEILFTMGSVWLLEQMEWNDGYWMIQLRSCNDLDSQLRELRNLTNGYTFLSMGNISRELGEYCNAKNFYRRMLEVDPLDNETRGLVYYHMGLLADELDEYMDALEHFHKAEELIPITASPNNSQPSNSRPLYAYNHLPSRVHMFNNTGRSYERKKDFKNALLYYEKALNEKSDPSDKAIVYYNMGLLQFRQGVFEAAGKYFTEAIQLGSGCELIKDAQQKLNIINDSFLRGAALLNN